MKTRILSFLIAIFCINSMLAQVENIGGYEYRLVEKKSSVLEEVDGSPYLYDQFLYGSLQMKNQKPIKVFLRYNVAYEEFEIKLEQQTEKIFVIPIENNVKYMIGAETLILDKLIVNGEEVYGYFIELFNGNRYRLLKKPVVQVRDAVEAQNGFQENEPAKLKVLSDYYVLDNEGATRKFRIKKRELKKAFPSSRAKKYLSKNKLKTYEDLVSFISHLDSVERDNES